MAKEKKEIAEVKEVKDDGLLWVEYDEAQKLIKEEKLVKEIKKVDGIKKYGFVKE